MDVIQAYGWSAVTAYFNVFSTLLSRRVPSCLARFPTWPTWGTAQDARRRRTPTGTDTGEQKKGEANLDVPAAAAAWLVCAGKALRLHAMRKNVHLGLWPFPPFPVSLAWRCRRPPPRTVVAAPHLQAGRRGGALRVRFLSTRCTVDQMHGDVGCTQLPGGRPVLLPRLIPRKPV